MRTVGVILEYRKSTFNIIIFSFQPRQCGTMVYKRTFSVDGPRFLFRFVLLVRLFVCLLVILFPFG